MTNCFSYTLVKSVMMLNHTFSLWDESADGGGFDNYEETATRVTTLVIVNCALNVPLMLISIFGNTVVLAAVATTSSLRSPSLILLCGLAVSDLVVGLVVQPIYIAKELTSDVLLLEITRTIGISFCGISFATMAAISVDRFLALRYPMTYNMFVTTRRVKLILIIIWVIHILLLSSFSVWYEPIIFYISLVFIAVYITASTVSYIGIYRIVRRHQLQILAQQQAVELSTDGNSFNLLSLSRTAVNTFVFYICTILCYFPWLIYRIFYAHIYVSNPNTAWVFTATLLFANSAINPFLYCWRLRELRVAVLKTVRKLSCKCIN
ncbi:adenosine receptor A2b-like [Oculina patagonica]